MDAGGVAEEVRGVDEGVEGEGCGAEEGGGGEGGVMWSFGRRAGG